MKKFFKKLFCKHTYRTFLGYDSNGVTRYYICNKCKKEKKY